MEKYQVIYIDPPWRYGGRSYNNPKKRKPLEQYYLTMTDKELKNLDIKFIADNNCVLFMWVVSSHLKQCIEVGESWQFKYVTVGFVWHKRRALLGNYTMSGCELCLIFKRGKIPQDKIKGRGNGVKQFYEQLSIIHSMKPDEFRNRISKLFPYSKKIELFARKKTEGWDCIGNDINNEDISVELNKLKNKFLERGTLVV